MEMRDTPHQRQQGSESAPGQPCSPLAAIPVSDYLRNLANQTVLHSQRCDLINEIRANRTTDEPRLRYAEHLESFPCTLRDKARAELIRLQIARRDGEPSAREREILIRHEREWLREMGHVRGVVWERGFMRAVTMSPRAFAGSQEPLSREPITELRIHTVGGSEEGGSDLRAAVSATHFQMIEKLSFWMASPSTLAYVGQLLRGRCPNLREVHFEHFHGSHQELLEACPEAHYPTEPDVRSPLNLAVGHIAVTLGSMR